MDGQVAGSRWACLGYYLATPASNPVIFATIGGRLDDASGRRGGLQRASSKRCNPVRSNKAVWLLPMLPGLGRPDHRADMGARRGHRCKRPDLVMNVPPDFQSRYSSVTGVVE